MVRKQMKAKDIERLENTTVVPIFQYVQPPTHQGQEWCIGTCDCSGSVCNCSAATCGCTCSGTCAISSNLEM